MNNSSITASHKIISSRYQSSPTKLPAVLSSTSPPSVLNTETISPSTSIPALVSTASINPFTLPTEDIFVLREQETAAKTQARAELAKLKIWEKPARNSNNKSSDSSTHSNSEISSNSTKPSNISSSSSYIERIAERAKFMSSSSTSRAYRTSDDLRRISSDSQFSPFVSSSSHSPPTNMSTFIAQKRDMFLLHMSLQTKRQEIEKLEEKAQMKEEALLKSEQMLEEDAMRFDAFLKENDRKAHESLKRADKESKEKNEKIMEIKKINSEIHKIESEMSKYEEQLSACLKYKQFLDSLTPKEWKEEAEMRRNEKKKMKKLEKDKLKTLLNNNNYNNNSNSTEVIDHGSDRDGAGDDTDEYEYDDDEEEEEMYFTDPIQLLDLFSQLEERNLFLIQNVQETEENVEEVKQKYATLEEEMNEKSQLLQSNIMELKTKIEIENNLKTSLLLHSTSTKSQSHQQILLNNLRDRVSLVYRSCGFDDGSALDTLDMLRDIESWLEYLLKERRNMNPQLVEIAEKKKNAERRTLIRQIKKEEQKKLYEERLAKSAARATAEVVKMTGKPVMFRSAPNKKKIKQENIQIIDEEEEELKQYFT